MTQIKTIFEFLLLETRTGKLTIENIFDILEECKFRKNMLLRHIKYGRWPPFQDQSNWLKLCRVLSKYDIHLLK